MRLDLVPGLWQQQRKRPRLVTVLMPFSLSLSSRFHFLLCCDNFAFTIITSLVVKPFYTIIILSLHSFVGTSIVRGFYGRGCGGHSTLLSESAVANCCRVFNVEPTLLVHCTFSTSSSSSRRSNGDNGGAQCPPTHCAASLSQPKLVISSFS